MLTASDIHQRVDMSEFNHTWFDICCYIKDTNHVVVIDRIPIVSKPNIEAIQNKLLLLDISAGNNLKLYARVMHGGVFECILPLRCLRLEIYVAYKQMTVIIVVLVITLILLAYLYQEEEGFQIQIAGNKKCSSCNASSNLLPVMNPMFNLREVVKNILLLEDHLFHTRKQCNDCIMKHFLIIEGLAEELVTLDKKLQCTKYHNIAEKIRKIEKDYIKNPRGKIEIAQKLRAVRKPLMKGCFSHF